ncbi:MAG TPA: FkbM family methyltransferase [Bacteroidales bacterium]
MKSKFKRKILITKQYIKLGSSIQDKFLLILYSLIRNRPFKGTNLYAKLGKTFIPKITFHTKSFNNYKIAFDSGDITHFTIVDEFLINKIYDLKKLNFIPEQIIDCGGHIGLFSVLAKSHFKNVPIVIFEPNPYNIGFIKNHIKINQIENIKLIEKAVSIVETDMWFDNKSASFGGHLINDKDNKGILVKTVDLLKFIPEKATKLLLKIDIEGEELKVVPHIINFLPNITSLFIETHDGEKSYSFIDSLLTKNGFKGEVISIENKLYYNLFYTRS